MLALAFPLWISFSPTTVPLLMHPYRQAGMLLPSRSVPCSQALSCPLFVGTVAGTGCVPGCLLHSTYTHTFIFLFPSCTHFFTLHGHPSSFSFLLACSLICSQSPKHIYTFQLTLPPLPRVGVHIRKKPGNPAGAGASAPSPTGTLVGLVWDQHLLQGYGAEEGGG